MPTSARAERRSSATCVNSSVFPCLHSNDSRRSADTHDREAGGRHVGDDRLVVVVDRTEADRDPRLPDVDHRVPRPRVTLRPAADRAAGHEMGRPDHPVERLVRVAEGEDVVRLVAGDPGEHAGWPLGPQVLVRPQRRAVEQEERAAVEVHAHRLRQLAQPRHVVEVVVLAGAPGRVRAPWLHGWRTVERAPERPR